MTTNRPYRSPGSRTMRWRSFAASSGTQLDPAVVEAFASVYPELTEAGAGPPVSRLSPAA